MDEVFGVQELNGQKMNISVQNLIWFFIVIMMGVCLFILYYLTMQFNKNPLITNWKSDQKRFGNFKSNHSIISLRGKKLNWCNPNLVPNKSTTSASIGIKSDIHSISPISTLSSVGRSPAGAIKSPPNFEQSSSTIISMKGGYIVRDGLSEMLTRAKNVKFSELRSEETEDDSETETEKSESIKYNNSSSSSIKKYLTNQCIIVAKTKSFPEIKSNIPGKEHSLLNKNKINAEMVKTFKLSKEFNECFPIVSPGKMKKKNFELNKISSMIKIIETIKKSLMKMDANKKRKSLKK